LLALEGQRYRQRLAQQYWFERALMHDRRSEPAETMQALQQRPRVRSAQSTPARHRSRKRSRGASTQIERWLEQGAVGAAFVAGDPRCGPRLRAGLPRRLPALGHDACSTRLLDAHPQIASIEDCPGLRTGDVARCWDPTRSYPSAMPGAEHRRT
jgi:hypothetical protein